MFRRLMSLLLMPGVLLTPSAAFGHKHDGGQPAGHDQRPHLHPVAHDHHHHHDDDDDHGPGDSSPHHEPVTDHDADALFVPAVDAVAGERFDAGADPASVPFGPPHRETGVIPVHGENGDGRVPWPHPPPTGVHCPLYVLHLTLVI